MIIKFIKTFAIFILIVMSSLSSFGQTIVVGNGSQGCDTTNGHNVLNMPTTTPGAIGLSGLTLEWAEGCNKTAKLDSNNKQTVLNTTLNIIDISKNYALSADAKVYAIGPTSLAFLTNSISSAFKIVTVNGIPYVIGNGGIFTSSGIPVWTSLPGMISFDSGGGSFVALLDNSNIYSRPVSGGNTRLEGRVAGGAHISVGDVIIVTTNAGEVIKIEDGLKYSLGFYNIAGEGEVNGNFYYSDGTYIKMIPTTGGVPFYDYSLMLTAILAGPYNPVADSMSTSMLNMGLLPNKCPYDTLVILTNVFIDMVDWVRIDMVDTLTGDTIYGSQCACLLKKGILVDNKGSGMIKFSLLNRPYVSIRIKHRNHLSVRTGALLPGDIYFDYRSGTKLFIDSTITGSGFHNIGLPEVLIPSGGSHPSRYALWPGDANGDGQVKYQGSGNDRGLILSAIGGSDITNTVTGYLSTDINLNGQVKYQGGGNDRGIVLSSIGGSVITKVTKAHD